MTVKGNVITFEWDSGNLDKSYLKHGILPKETEEVFFEEESIVLPGFIIVGKSLSKLNLFIVFTLRGSKVRVISVRKMHREEVERYEKVKKDTKI
jgi:uncharacterized DUF497 family protein